MAVICPEGGNLHGIDVSHWQGDINWSLVASDNVNFVFCKASEGTSHIDERFVSYVQGARAAGLPVGGYHFLRPRVDVSAADQEAQHFINVLELAFGAGNYGDLFPVADVESPYPPSTVNTNQLLAYVQRFREYFESRTKRRLMLYTGNFFIQDYNNFNHPITGNPLRDMPLWIAFWSINCPDIIAGWSTWECWQYTDQGSIQGIAGNVDRNTTRLNSVDYLKPPAAPTGLEAIPGDGSVSLSWDDNSDADLVSYNIYRNDSRIVSDYVGTSYVDSSLTNGVNYFYNVTANDQWEESPYSNTVHAIPFSEDEPVVELADIGQIMVFNQREELEAILDNRGQRACPFRDAVSTERLDGESIFEFSIPANHKDAEFVIEGNLIAAAGADLEFQLYEIVRVEEIHEDEVVKNVYCENAFFELLDEFIDSLELLVVNPSVALEGVLSGTRWSVGYITVTGFSNYFFLRKNVVECINEIVNRYGGQLRYRVTVQTNRISNRFIDILERRGSDTGKRFIYGRNLSSVRRTVDSSNLVTALYAYGKSSEVDENEVDKFTFKDVEWSISNGDPVDKPLGQIWVGDPDALVRWGRNAGTRHRFGYFEDGKFTDGQNLLMESWNRLQVLKNPEVIYEVKGVDLERILGLAHEAVRLGDGVIVIDNEFKPPLAIEAKVNEIKRNISVPEETEFVLGNVMPLITDEGRILRSVRDKVNDQSGEILATRVRRGTLTLGGAAGELGIFEILDENEDVIGRFSGDRESDNFGRLGVGEIYAGNIILHQTSRDIYVDSGSGNDVGGDGSSGNPYRTINHAFKQIGRYIRDRELVRIICSGTFDEVIRITGFHGGGQLDLNLQSSIINGAIYCLYNTCQIRIIGTSAANRAQVRSIGSEWYPINCLGNSYLWVQFVKFDCRFFRDWSGSFRFGNHSIRNCSFVGASTAAVGFQNANAYLLNCIGGDAPYGVSAIHASIVGVEGTVPNGNTNWFFEAPDSIVKPQAGVTPTNDTSMGSATNPVVAIIRPTMTRSWRTVDYNWRPVNNDRIYQGQWQDFGNHWGYMFFGNQLDVLIGKTILEGRLFIRRFNGGGLGGDQPIRFYGHSYTVLPVIPFGSEPVIGTHYGQLVSLSWGEYAEVLLPTIALNEFRNGTSKGLVIYQPSEAPYVILDGISSFDVRIQFVYF